MNVPTKIIAHRGNSSSCHENTMAAFERAVIDEADGIEFDLRLTRDRQWVIHHDPDVIFDGNRRRIADLTQSDIAAVRVGPKSDPIPTLNGFLGWAKHHRIQLVFDIKDSNGIPELIASVEAIEQRLPPLFSCFRKSTLGEIHRLRPDWSTALIVGDVRSGVARHLWLSSLLRWAATQELLALHLHERWTGQDVVDRVHDAGFNVAVWTVDDPKPIALLAEMGVDAIITNYPDTATLIIDALRHGASSYDVDG